MTVKITKDALNLREKLSELDKPSGIAGQDILKADTPQEVFNYIGAGRRNIIINGAMQVSQRGTSSTSITSSGYYTCDRFKWVIGNLGTWTVEQSTDAPSGFSNSFKFTTTTADASPASSDYAVLIQYIEAQNLQHLAYGTSDAKQLTMSFWVKSNKTGNATFEMIQPDNNGRHISFSYSINVADTWEYKTIVIPAHSSGIINNDNGPGFEILWWVNSGSDFTGGSHPETWTNRANANRNPSNLGVGGATSDYFAITGVQLEVGSVATPFEHRSYGEELARCQRYYQVLSYTDGAMIASGIAANSSAARAAIYFNTMRAAPTVTLPTAGQSSGTQTYLNTSTAYPTTTGTHTASAISVRSFRFNGDSYSGLTGSYPAWLYSTGNTEIELSAEL